MDLTINRKARFDYNILETYEAGIQLFGHEVKSLRAHRGGIAGAFVVLKNGEAFLLGAIIPPYQTANVPKGYDPVRSRKLLLHRKEIAELIGITAQGGLTLVALELYTKGPRVKLKFAVAKKRKKYDKRDLIKKRDTEREMRRSI